MNARPYHQALHRATTALFLVALTLPLALHLVTADDARDILQENRTPAPRPSASAEPASWAALPKALEDYYRDFVRGRTSLLRTQRWLRWELFGATPVGSQTIRGEDDWIFFTGNAALEQHRGRQPWSDEMLAQACEVLERRRAQLAERGVRYLFVVAPDKMSIYPEQLPPWALPLAERTPIDQLLEAAEARGLSDAILDLRPVLRAKKGELPLYYARGTHWNSLGAYHGYAAIAERLRSTHWPRTKFGAEILELPSDAVVLDEVIDDSWGERWHLGDVLRHPNAFVDLPELFEHVLGRCWWPQVEAQRARPDRLHRSPRPPGSPLLVFHDSFWDGLVPYFANHFAAIAASSTYRFDPRLVEALHPRVVLQVCVERNLWIPFRDPLDPELPRPWLREEELSGIYRSPRWDEVRIERLAPGALRIDGPRVGQAEFAQRSTGIYTGSSPLLGELRLAFFHEGGLANFVLLPSGSAQAFRFLAEASAGAPAEPLAPWAGRYENGALVRDLVARAQALWVFDEHGELAHVLTSSTLGGEGGVAVDERQPELRWRFAKDSGGAAHLWLEMETESEQHVELVRRAQAR